MQAVHKVRDRLGDVQVAKAADVFHLLGDGTRLRIVLACLDAPLNVGAIADAAEASASLVSHHLRLLKAGDLVRAERRGREVYYHAADAHVRSIVSDMMAHVTEGRD
jgi:DNA-binding transcriptional ArsR family regulator